jgi:hypothetical protein
MSATLEDVLQPFQAAASAAHIVETEFSKEFDRELARRRREREFAFRRLGLVKALGKAACAESDEAAIAAQLSALRNELGWHETSAVKERALDAFLPVAKAIRSQFAPEDAKVCPSVPAAFAAFEAWYLKDTGQPFLALLDHEIPEMPLVDF